MKTRFFCFPDMETSVSLAAAAGMVDAEGFVAYCSRWAVDVIGAMQTPGEWDAEGNLLKAPVPIPGWHVNVRTDEPVPKTFLPYEVFPATPSRDFA